MQSPPIQQAFEKLSDAEFIQACEETARPHFTDDTVIVKVCKELWPQQSFSVHMLIAIIPHMLQVSGRRLETQFNRQGIYFKGV